MKNETLAQLCLAAAFVLLLAACPSPETSSAPPPSSPPTTYNRVIIDTYRPNIGMSSNTDTFLSLFDSRGTAAPPIVEADEGNLTYNTGYARIDYSGGLISGKYYVRVKGGTLSADGPYAFRILLSMSAPPNEYSAGDYFLDVADPDPHEPDDALLNNVPLAPVHAAVGTDYNRYLTTGGRDVDWFTFTLP